MNSSYELAHIHPEESLRPCPELAFNPEERVPGLAPISHSTPRREPWALPQAHIQPRGEDLRPFLSLTFTTTRSLPDIHDISSLQRFLIFHWTAQQQGFPDREGSYAATISPPSSVGPVINSGGYLGIVNPNSKAHQSERSWKDLNVQILQI